MYIHRGHVTELGKKVYTTYYISFPDLKLNKQGQNVQQDLNYVIYLAAFFTGLTQCRVSLVFCCESATKCFGPENLTVELDIQDVKPVHLAVFPKCNLSLTRMRFTP